MRLIRYSLCRPAAAGLLLLTLAGVGCNRHPFTAVEGMATLDGKPLPQALVRFELDQSAGFAGPPGEALTDTDGRFRLDGLDGRSGVRAGQYRVCVLEPDRDLLRGQPPTKRDVPIPSVYGSYLRTPFQVAVQPGLSPVALEMVSNP